MVSRADIQYWQLKHGELYREMKLLRDDNKKLRQLAEELRAERDDARAAASAQE